MQDLHAGHQRHLVRHGASCHTTASLALLMSRPRGLAYYRKSGMHFNAKCMGCSQKPMALKCLPVLLILVLHLGMLMNTATPK